MITIQRPRIELYVRRTFSEKLSATFDFISENFRPLFKYLSAFLLPLCAVAGLCYTVMFGQLGDLAGLDETAVSPVYDLGINYAVMMGVSLVSFVVLTAVVYTLMQLYWAREGRLVGIVYSEISPSLRVNLTKMFRLTGVLALFGVAGVVLVVIVFAVGAGMFLTVTSPGLIAFLLILAYALLLLALVPLTLSAPAYVFGDMTVWQAVRQAYRLGIRVWGGLVGMFVVLSLVVQLVSMALGLPFLILSGLKMVSLVGLESDGMRFAGTYWFTFVTYLSGVLFMFGTYMAMALVQVGAAFYYGHAAEKIDGVAMDMAVERFETLTGTGRSGFAGTMTADMEGVDTAPKDTATRPETAAGDGIDDFEKL